MPAQLTFTSKAKADGDAATEELFTEIRKLDGVSSVARAASTTDKRITGFVMFENAELAAAARNQVNNDEKAIYTLDDPARDAPVKPEGKKKGGKNAKAAANRGMPMPAADFFNGPSPSTMPREEPRRGRGRGGAGRGGAGEGRGRGGPRGNNNNNGPRGRRPPTVQAFSACVHNVPFHVTNDQVFQAFKHCGHIFDIRRMEKIALLLMRDPQSVTEAIVTMNGKECFDSKLAVCSGGEMRLPMPPPPAGPMPPAGAPPAGFPGQPSGPAVRLPVAPPELPPA